MRMSRFLSFMLILGFLAACGNTPGASPAATQSGPTLPAPSIHITSAPDAQSAARAFLEAWKANDFAAMYALIDPASQQAITQEDFVKRYRNAMNALTLNELQYEIISTNTNPADAQVTFRVTYQTNLIGALVRDITINFKLDNGQWRMAWDEGVILPELRGGNHLSMDPNPPARGIIYDRNGEQLVTQTEVTALGVIPNQIIDKQEPSLITTLGALTNRYPGAIMALYDANRYTDWYVPIGEILKKDADSRRGALLGLGGVVINDYTARFYVDGGIAPQIMGYVSPLQPDELDSYVRQGYSQAARVGRIGIEKWGEKYLAGKSGGTIYVISPDGKPITSLGSSDSQPASSIYLTIDKNLQYYTQRALEGFRGAAVVIDRSNGRILAMASAPGFDPNLFEPNNYNSGTGLGNLVNDADNPLLNRAAQGRYPLGSVFKVITFSAALESKTYTIDTNYNCQYSFEEITGHTMYDWTYEHYMSELAATGEGKTQPSGMLTLTQGLMRSCNPYFWHIGLDLFKQGRTSAVADMARGFGLGSATGIAGIDEDPGVIQNPTTELEATNQAIGQGDVLVTPLQVARFMAAIGNGGTLYRPQVVEKIVDANGNVTQVYKAEANARPLPMTSQTLEALRFAMREVVKNPRGTAHYRLQSLQIPVFGKTGTAESNIPGEPHAWFAGYTDANIEGVPDIAIAVVTEYAGEGSQISAPIFRRIVETYFYGHPVTPYWWETSIGVTRTPTSPISPTPGQ
jgi:penicillin-binding protein 2